MNSKRDFVDECREFAGPVWDSYIHHPWIEALFSGELDDERFNYWLAQDLSFIFDTVNLSAIGKCPPNNPWAERTIQLFSSARTGRVESRLISEHGEFAKSRWAARPARESMSNFLFRAAAEGTFGEYCCAQYACSEFANTFARRFEEMSQSTLPPEQADWVAQFAEPWEREINVYLVQGINEAGAYAPSWLRDQMKWYFLRGVQHQIATFDAAWQLSDPWPGIPDDTSILAGAAPRLP